MMFSNPSPDPKGSTPMLPNLLRAILMAALFGAAVLIGGGLLARLGTKAGSAVRNVT